MSWCIWTDLSNNKHSFLTVLVAAKSMIKALAVSVSNESFSHGLFAVSSHGRGAGLLSGVCSVRALTDS